MRVTASSGDGDGGGVGSVSLDGERQLSASQPIKRSSSGSSGGGDGGVEDVPWVTHEEIALVAKRRGLSLDTVFTGPFFKITATRLSTRAGGGGDEAEIIGEHDGFIAPPPFGIIHMDSMRIYNSRIRGDDEKASIRSVFGITYLLATASVRS